MEGNENLISPDRDPQIAEYCRQLAKLRQVIRALAAKSLAKTWPNEEPGKDGEDFENFAVYMNALIDGAGIFPEKRNSLTFMERAIACRVMGFAPMLIKVTPGGMEQHPASLVLDIVQLVPGRGETEGRVYESLTTLGVSDGSYLPPSAARTRFLLWVPTPSELDIAQNWRESEATIAEQIVAARTKLSQAVIDDSDLVILGGGEGRAADDQKEGNLLNFKPRHLRLLPPT